MPKEIKVDEPIKQMTVEEFDAFLEVYKVNNPQKYAIKLEKGEFDKYRKGLQSGNASVAFVDPVNAEPVKIEDAPEQPRRGRPPKE